ncbi:unnamed protein product [Diamesa hyperborea]
MILINMKQLKLVTTVMFGFLCTNFAQDFTYEGSNGPNHWGEQFNTCKGKHQSPIDIDVLKVKHMKLPALKLNDFDDIPAIGQVTNNGHTVMYTLDAEKTPTIEGGPIDGQYEFAQLHFHWGGNDSYGSEDLILGKSFPMELHMVFYKKEYRLMRSALNHPDGLTVLAFFFEISKEPNPAYEEITEILAAVIKSESNATFINPPALRGLISDNLDEYYVYNGSLTTPPCSEVVTWIDFLVPIPLSHDQIENFRSLEDNEGNIMNHNFRPIQPINDRIVWFNSNDFELNDNTIEENNLSNDKDNDVTILAVKKRKNSGIKIKTNLSLIILLCTVTLIKIFLP